MSTDSLLRPQPQPTPAPDSPRRPRRAGRAPARPTAAAAFHSISAVTAVLLGLVAIGAMIHEPVLIPPLAASAALVHSAPTLPLAQPRSLVLGHLLGAGSGYAVLALTHSSPWTAALAGGITLAATMLARTPHSAACATAVIVVLQTPHSRALRAAAVRLHRAARPDRVRGFSRTARGAQVPGVLVVTSGTACPAPDQPEN